MTGPATLVLLILAGFFVVRGERPPGMLGLDADPADFSAMRAMRDVEAIAAQPHPVASADHDRVRDYLVGRLRELGASPELHAAPSLNRRFLGPANFATVINVVARIPGTKSSGTVLLVAHYDSVPSGPGAGDDASSVAAILEAVRALHAAQPLKNDVGILLTDGEELGLLGAWAFAADPSLKNVKVVLNFEMRGDSGASTMFQTSRPDEGLIDNFAAAAPYPRATSIAEAVYRHQPNNTDLSVFLYAGLAGMNFAARGGLVRYHTALDDLPHLDRDTLQHQGSYALTMARRLGNIDLGQPQPTGNQVYFVIGAHLFHYSERLALPLAVLIAFVVIRALVIGIRARRFAPGAIAIGTIVYLAALAIAAAEARAFSHLMVRVSGWKMLAVGTTYGGIYFETASCTAIVASLWAIYAALRRRVGLQHLGAGALAVLTLLMLIVSVISPAGSYLLAWPILFAAIALGANIGATNGHPTMRPAAWTLVALVPATAFYVPLITFGDGTALSMAIAAVAIALMLGLAVPYFDLLSDGIGWIVPAAMAVIAVAAFVVGISKSGFDAEHPHPDSICYLLNADNSKASWLSVDYRPDRFTAQFFHQHVRGESLAHLTGLLEADDYTRADEAAALARNFTSIGNGRAIVGDAPMVSLAPPEITVQSDSSAAGVRTLKLHLRSARGAPIIRLAVPVGINVLGGSINGLSAGAPPTDGWSASYWNAPPAGLDVELRLGVPDATAITVIDQSWGMPATPDFTYRPRGAEQMPAPFVDFDSATLVTRTLPIAAAGSANH